MGTEILLYTALGELGAGELQHSNRTLLDHLSGTYQLLKEWDNDEEICLAGLFHSIYGTVYFSKTTVSLSERPKIVDLIGERAERLAYIFCAINRQELFEQSKSPPPFPVKDRFADQMLEVSKADFEALFEIEIANFLEQVADRSALKAEKIPWYAEYFGRCEGYVSSSAYQNYRRFFALDDSVAALVPNSSNKTL